MGRRKQQHTINSLEKTLAGTRALDETQIRPECHPHVAVLAFYQRGGHLRLFCAACDAPVLEVAVPAGEQAAQVIRQNMLGKGKRR